MRNAVLGVLLLVACRGSSKPVAKPTPTDGGGATADAPVVVENDASPPPATDGLTPIEPDALVGSEPWVPYRVPCDPKMVCDHKVWWTDPADADDKDVQDYLFFFVQPFERDGKTEQIALWQFSDDPGNIHGALLSGGPGQWKPLWVKHPAFKLAGNEPEDWMDEDVVQLPVVQIGPSRWALLYAPDVYEGDGEGGPEAFFVMSQLIELAPDGPKQVWHVEAPPCFFGEMAPQDHFEACAITTKPREGADAYDLEVTIKVKRKKTTTYRFVDGAYQAVKK